MVDMQEPTRRLVDAGLKRRQAMALIGVLRDAFRERCVTRTDLAASVSSLTRALTLAKVHWIAWQVIVAVALFVALRFIG